MRLPPRREMRPDSPALRAVQFRVLIKHIRNLDLLYGIPDSPQEHSHKSIWTLRSPQQREIALCTANELEMRPDSPALSPEPCRIPHQTHVA